MRFLNYVFLLLFVSASLNSCNKQTPLKEEVWNLYHQWGFEFPLPSENDSINLLYIQMEKAYFTLQFKKMDSLAKKILSIDSSFYMALSFQAFGEWPFNLKKLEMAKSYASKDTSVHRLIFEGDYSYWIEHDTLKALKLYTEVYNRYPKSKIAAWLAGMASLWSHDYEMAAFYYNRSLEIDSAFYHAYYDLGDTYYQSGEHQLSIKNFKKFLQFYPEKYRIYSVIADQYIILNDSLKAKQYFHIADSIKNTL